MQARTLPPTDEMYQALVGRDAAYEGIFVVGVRTTGIFCRSTCPARKPARQNVEFFAGAAEALFAGYRPCKRCHPMEPAGAVPKWLRALIEALETDPARRWQDEDLRSANLDPARVRRLTGESPGRTRGTEVVHITRLSTPLGPMLVGATEVGLCLLEFADRRMLETQLKRIQERMGAVIVPGETEITRLVAEEIAAYFEGGLRVFSVPLLTPGTAFQETVWAALQTIPYGISRSYSQLAKKIGRAKAVRAVAGANGANRIAIIIPCHRVLGADGSLTGYGGGLWRKRWLLELEGALSQQERVFLKASVLPLGYAASRRLK
jgi:AraC family transcriptional regulator, regulatory protein of adaptative response / methylated-DNA-[protein]-cysteine methyltransferase